MTSPHGDINLSIQGQILTAEGYGPWNLETIQQSNIEHEFLKQKAILCQNPWGVLVIAKGDAMFVPDARNKLKDIVEQDRKDGRVATAIVVEDCLAPSFIIEHLSAIYTEAGDAVEYFATPELAKKWLIAQIAKH